MNGFGGCVRKTFISTYNSAMGGTDFMYQKLSYYLTIVRTKKVADMNIYTISACSGFQRTHTVPPRQKSEVRNGRIYTLRVYTDSDKENVHMLFYKIKIEEIFRGR